MVPEMSDDELLSLARNTLSDEGVCGPFSGKDSVRFVDHEYALAICLERFGEQSGRVWRCNIGIESEPESTVDCISVFIHECGKSYVFFHM